MKLTMFLGGLLIGAGLGLMAGAALVGVPEGGGERKYPVFLSMLLTMTGVILARYGWRPPLLPPA
jgi:hypothetical protein